MRPGYETRMKQERIFYPSNHALRTVALRTPEIYIAKISIYAEVERDKPSNLYREGIMRVLDDRENDPDYMGHLPAEAKDKLAQLEIITDDEIAALEARLAAARAARQLGEER